MRLGPRLGVLFRTLVVAMASISFFYAKNMNFFAKLRICGVPEAHNQGFPARWSGKEFQISRKMIHPAPGVFLSHVSHS